MKTGVPIALIIVGGCLILGPVLANAYTRNRDKTRIAEFYTRNSNAAVLPAEMQSSGYGGYDWACLVAGAAAITAGIGVTRSRHDKTQNA
ncbi:MAG: hypothetical protein FJ387_26560 [Verrucomicrobia bacterium]|nr:hypothetical protein [Verrucomicrobiota bacterium]